MRGGSFLGEVSPNLKERETVELIQSGRERESSPWKLSKALLTALESIADKGRRREERRGEERRGEGRRGEERGGEERVGRL